MKTYLIVHFILMIVHYILIYEKDNPVHILEFLGIIVFGPYLFIYSMYLILTDQVEELE